MTQPVGVTLASSVGILPTNTGVQNSDAWDTWYASLPVPGATLLLDLNNYPTNYYDFARTIQITKPIIIKGSAGGGRGGGLGAYMRWPVNTTGIQIKPYSGGPSKGDNTRLEDLLLVGLGYGGATSGYGIFMQAHASVVNCSVTNFGSHGVYIEGTNGSGTNANNWYLERVASCENKGNGFHFDGADSNAGLALLCDGSSNIGYGFYDSSFLGNTYVGCHADANVTGSYKVDEANSRALFLGCYVESNQPLPVLGSTNAAWIGGLAQGAWSGGGSFVMRDGIVERFSARPAGGNAWSNSSLITFGSASHEGEQAYLRYAHVTKGGLNTRIATDGSPLYETYSPEYTTIGLQVAGLGHVINGRQVFGAAHIFPAAAGYFVGNVRVDSGASAPSTSGSYYKTWCAGDRRLNSNPSVGVTPEWVCVNSGTLGTYTEGRTVTANGTTTLVLSAASSVLQVGDYIIVFGITTRISAKNGTTLTVLNNIPAGVGLSINYKNPTFAAQPALVAWP